MTHDPSVMRLQSWLQSQFPGSSVEVHYIDNRSVVLFRVHVPSERSREIEVTERALEDHTPEAIIQGLIDGHAIEHLQRDPSLRPCVWSREGLVFAETRIIECDGRMYRVVRDPQHNVRIFDSRERPLENLPPSLVLPSSIHRRVDQEWREEIRAWRGKDQ